MNFQWYWFRTLNIALGCWGIACSWLDLMNAFYSLGLECPCPRFTWYYAHLNRKVHIIVEIGSHICHSYTPVFSCSSVNRATLTASLIVRFSYVKLSERSTGVCHEFLLLFRVLPQRQAVSLLSSSALRYCYVMRDSPSFKVLLLGG